ncbi:hypothetical protein VCHA53O466_40110 [Vibrio chagasii]|nr:hypothetical protein VCHA53O466_40110 [Vibrio chagasii]
MSVQDVANDELHRDNNAMGNISLNFIIFFKDIAFFFNYKALTL